MYTISRLAFDRSARRFDADGRLHVDASHISKATVNPYYGQEIPGWQELGLEPDRVYQLLRDPLELAKAAPTFNNLPILSKHVAVSADDPKKDLVVGSIGSDVAFNAPYLDASLCIWDAAGVAAIETDTTKELSCAYRYVPVMESGTFEGQPYDGKMTQIQGNHLALVEVGRAGPDVVVADATPFKKETPAMKKTKLGNALIVALGLASPVLAADSALAGLVGRAERKTFDKAAVKAKLLAMDAGIDPEQLDNIIDAILDVEQSPEAKEIGAADEDDEEEAKKKAEAAADEDDDKDEKVSKTAMDAAIANLRESFKQLEAAKSDVRATVGDVMGMDSAEDVYAFALKQMAVDHAGVTGVAALRALYRVASDRKAAPAVTDRTQFAQDSADATKAFPGLARFK